VKIVLRESTPKQIGLLKKLMGDRWEERLKYIPSWKASKLIDSELRKKPKTGATYMVVASLAEAYGEEDDVREYSSFYDAKKELDWIVDDIQCRGLRIVKVTDVCWEVYGTRSNKLIGTVYIKKK
jgi:hypothetical protein